MKFKDIVSRVKYKLDDPDGTYITDDYVMGFAQDAYEWIYNKLRLTGSQFDEAAVIIANVKADTSDLSTFQAPGQPLANLVQPRTVRWRQPGQDPTYFRRVDGPLDAVRDVPDGLQTVDSWAWVKNTILLSKFGLAVDLEVTGEFLFDPVTEQDTQLQISLCANRVFSCKLASEIGKARGNDKWTTTYSADADEAIDDLAIALTKAEQAKTRRVGRMSRSAGSNARISQNH